MLLLAKCASGRGPTANAAAVSQAEAWGDLRSFVAKRKQRLEGAAKKRGRLSLQLRSSVCFPGRHSDNKAPVCNGVWPVSKGWPQRADMHYGWRRRLPEDVCQAECRAEASAYTKGSRNTRRAA